ncbi:ras-related protein rab-5c [Anaeramoeba flamelloides]|uniref:Ras-related protein rab-5c n=1 Tax=Anaeramoeba flamelloides TaxID=1746091 RepID=A0AAV7ZDR9_9EUKA|nr:ras-related protein rab-5c [Anaeramoeba flamelloides]KAJ6248070.1 ras-related protein rab-5c [Anaeramoeba flamelloides]
MSLFSADSSDEELPKQNVIKIVMLGQTGCGKTSIVMRFIENTFSETTSTTIGAAFFLKTVMINNEPINIRLWDTSGQERFKSLVPLYYRHAAAAVLVFDPSDTLSFTKLKYWQNELENNCERLPVIAIVANKADLNLNEQQKELILKAQNYAKQSQIQFFQTSAKTGKSIQDLFHYLLEQVLKQQQTQINKQKLEWDQPIVSNKKNTKDKNNENSTCC